MSPQKFAQPTAGSAITAVRRLWVGLGIQVRDARRSRRWSMQSLAERAGVSRASVHLVESGGSVSVEMAIRLAGALGLRLEVELVDPRKRPQASVRSVDPVHSLMGEFEVAHLRAFRHPTGVDEPYQHFQFAGRADVIAWDLEARALLHLENRTRFPDFQEMAGSFNSKRAYLGESVAKRLGIGRWASQTHVIVGLWSAEVLHSLRLRPEPFRSLCPDQAESVAAWWTGQRATAGLRSALVVLDPLATGRQRQWIGLEEAIASARPRHRGYADVVSRMAVAS